jgi:protein-disulfide isomerase
LPYCRKDAPALAELIAGDGKVRLVLKELPVLGANSDAVARIALAAQAQGKYLDFHKRLIGASGRATKEKALRIASELGLDTARLERDAQGPDVTHALAENELLADRLGIRGVPFYLVGDSPVAEGNKDLSAALAAKVADIRANGCRAAC